MTLRDQVGVTDSDSERDFVSERDGPSEDGDRVTDSESVGVVVSDGEGVLLLLNVRERESLGSLLSLGVTLSDTLAS